MKWVTNDQLTLERMDCPWLIRRFIDAQAEIAFLPENEIDAAINNQASIPFDLEGVEFSSTSSQSAFEKFLVSYRFTNPALSQMARLIKTRDRKKLEEALQSAGITDLIPLLQEAPQSQDHLVRNGMALYDALYTWCHSQQDFNRVPESKTNMTKVL